MSRIRCIYRDAPPEFPASDQSPDAVRYGPLDMPDGSQVFVDAIGGEPTIGEIEGVLTPTAPPEPTPLQKLEAAGLSVAGLRALLGMPAA
ncbi:hypothetical protein ONR75_24010 [Rhodopseudomonas sp. P2A-2r]|uniref:hypothetical protein n=1 Tax=Rhodopseudomonas sp. P2A-2r TaxID=2991972 RepID=UPI00223489F4|nr:hypothetical protein [Rhodopseudomonas sp. P2A-2r]UZE47904.1 hypothetical protein ONR75_24010 [Rhodopseudomonas sp. P2A-2r]